MTNFNPTSLVVLVVAYLISHELYLQEHLVAAEEALTAKDEFLLTHEQKKNFKKLKELVTDWMVVEYMKSGLYHVRRFRDKMFDVDKTAQAINETLKMRVEYAMDEVLSEDWSAYNKKFQEYDGFTDRKGRPVWYGLAQNWDIASELESGNWRNFTRYFFSLFERKAVESIMMYEQTKKVARFVSIIDWHNVPILSISCPLCVPWGKQFFKFTTNYPYFMFRAVNINVPPTVKKFLDVITSVCTDEMKKLIVLFGSEVPIWKKYLTDLLGSEDNRIA